ncbi:MAG: hypothetical protein HXO58_09675 [Rothia mucilaginosa]|uniref:Transmembrane protein n=1 Tax=Rothia mucilaginosa TaxID=43675 RepID=A0A930LBS4_9MICC|nr:hypothetical protein [Rothia mucilaginosa]MBF1660082.1 hypothetical protein [Rothia mucilaginosa]
MDDIGDFIIGFFEVALASSTTLQRVFLWILFSASVLLLLVPVITGEYAWNVIPISTMLFSVVMIDGTHKHSVQDAKNGGAYHYFLLTVGTFCVAAIILLATLSLAGVPQVALTPQTDGINFAPWYVAVSALVLLLFFYNAAEPNEEIPNLRRMERINRYVRTVVLGVSALIAFFCLLIPVVSFATAGYEPVGVSVVLCLVPVFLIFVRRALFKLWAATFEEGTAGYGVLRGFCIALVGLGGCLAAARLAVDVVQYGSGLSLVYVVPVIASYLLVKRYLTVGVAIPEKEDEEEPEAEPAAS